MKNYNIEKQQYMMLCPLCRDNEEYHYPENDIHITLNNMHHTLGVTWKPEKGHKDYETHQIFIKNLHKIFISQKVMKNENGGITLCDRW